MTGQQIRKSGRTQSSGAGSLEDSLSSSSRRLAQLLAAGLGLVVAFQLLLAAGAPFGAAAYGGADTGRLSSELRTTSMSPRSSGFLPASPPSPEAGWQRRPSPTPSVAVRSGLSRCCWPRGP
jgi:hypothetical protein